MRQADDAISLATAAVIAGARSRILWQSVLLLALHDAARGDERAEAWLDTESCRFICDAAGVDHHLVRTCDLARFRAQTRRTSNVHMGRGPRLRGQQPST
ncbi:MAG: hypothetical protein RIF41_28265 [Polyangiaceae bacterium]